MAPRTDERSSLLSNERVETSFPPPRRRFFVFALIVAASFVLIGGNTFISNADAPSLGATFLRYPSARLRESKHKKKSRLPFEPIKRCEWVEDKIREKDAGKSKEDLIIQYKAQSTDYNVFHRATAHLFWNDFVAGNWGNWTMSTLKLPENTLNPKSLWTWVTGDQHLSNFGAWRNRHDELVYGVNDFDEAAIYDFHIDILRIAVSICNHAITNGLSPKQVDKALGVLTESYIKTVHGYIGNDKALLFELTPKTSYGVLRKFMIDSEKKNSASGQLQKFTDVDETTGERSFTKGNKTKLFDVAPDIEQKIINAFSPTQYGATMMKLGWHVRQWDKDYFQVLDVAERIGTGIGSFGVDRFYVLLKGTDRLLGEDGRDGTAVILDIKEQPLAAVERVLSANDKAWYGVMFPNAAARVVEAQRHLTSYVDPFTGWFLFHDTATGIDTPISIRQRSPWKDSIDLDELTSPRDFSDFVAQIAIATATSHVRGTVAKAPAQFKQVFHSIMKHDKKNRKKWGVAVAELANQYHEQLLLDFECFQDFVETYYSANQV